MRLKVCGENKPIHPVMCQLPAGIYSVPFFFSLLVSFLLKDDTELVDMFTLPRLMVVTFILPRLTSAVDWTLLIPASLITDVHQK